MKGRIKGGRLGSCCGNLIWCGKIYNTPCSCMCQTLFLRVLHVVTHGTLITSMCYNHYSHFTEEEMENRVSIQGQ